MFLRQYSEVLIHKLEDKMEELDKANRELQRDIAKRKRAAEALLEERNLLRTLIDNMPDYIYFKDASSRFLVANRTVARIMGAKSAEELLGKTDLDFYPREIGAAYIFDEQAIIQSGQALLNQEEKALDLEGKPRWTLTSKVPLRNNQGQVIGIVGMGRDITETKRLAQQLNQSQKMESMGRLAGGVAHDFNNLLTVVLSYCDALLDRADLEPRVLKQVEEIKKAGIRAASLTRQLLAFSRQQVLEPKILNLNAIVTDTEKMLRRLIGEDLELLTTLGPNLGSVKADPGQIEQIIMNLAVNARDAMPEGGRLIIETSNADLDEEYARFHPPTTPGRYVLLTVTDTGIGMDHETKAHIFEPFFTRKNLVKELDWGFRRFTES